MDSVPSTKPPGTTTFAWPSRPTTKAVKRLSNCWTSTGRRVILMNGFDFKRHVFWLPAALADPSQKVWKLVYQTLNRSFTCARPARVQALAPLDALTTLEEAAQLQSSRMACPYCAHSSSGKCSHAAATGRGLESGLTTTWPPTRQDVKSRRLLEQLNAAGK